MSEEDESYDSSWSVYSPERSTDGYAGEERLRKRGTNVHSSIAGISVQSALMTLAPPPPDALPGSQDAPWLRLTDWEMMNLRKRMKKNAKWRPSESMVKLELINAGRGPHNYWEAKQDAEARGLPFLDVDNIASSNADRPLAWGEVSLTAPSSSEERPRNKGMVLNEAKKRKRAESIAYLDQFSSTNSRSSSKSSEETQPRKKATPHVPRVGKSPIALDSANNPSVQSCQSSEPKKVPSSLLTAPHENDKVNLIRDSSEGPSANLSLSNQAKHPASLLVTAVGEETISQNLTVSSQIETETGQEVDSKRSDFTPVAMKLPKPFTPASELSSPQEEEQTRTGLTDNGTSPVHSTSLTTKTAARKASSPISKPSITNQSVRQPRPSEQIVTQRSAVSQSSPRVKKQLPKKQMLNGKPLFDHRHSLAKIVGKKPPITPKPLNPVIRPLPMAKLSAITRPLSSARSLSNARPLPNARPLLAAKPSPATKPSPAIKPSPAVKPSPASRLPQVPKNASGSSKPGAKRKYVPGGPGGGGRYVDA